MTERHSGAHPSGQLVTLRDWRPSRPVMTDAVVLANDWRADRYWLLRLDAPAIAQAARPGQFAMLTLARDDESEPALPRPMALYDWSPGEGWVDILYGVVGPGTRRLAGFQPSERIGVLGPLGHGFTSARDVSSVLAVGRGIGICSIARHAADAGRAGARVFCVLSGRSPEAIVGRALLSGIPGVGVLPVCDSDGTSDPGRLAAELRRLLDDAPPRQIVTCGSERLLGMCAGLADRWSADLQVSVEAHMACGLGYCHGCASGMRDATAESPLVCRDGPVFRWMPRSRLAATAAGASEH